jgi:thioredoxin 1
MATVELTTENFDQVVKGPGLVLVDFWASWCGPCRMFAPVYERAAEKHRDAVFGKVDADAQTELAQAFNVYSIPTLMVVRDGVVLYSEAGALPESALEELIGKAKEIDMDEVHAKIAEQAKLAEQQAEA